MENLNKKQPIEQTQQHSCLGSVERCFNSSDIGKVFWRVEYRGVITQCLIFSINEKNEAVIKVATLTDFRNEEYKLKNEVDYFGTSTYGIDIIQENKQYYFDFEMAKKASIERFNKEVNPNGKYRVARYFDDMFECFVTGSLSKKEARLMCDEFNSQPRAYVSYGLKNIE